MTIALAFADDQPATRWLSAADMAMLAEGAEALEIARATDEVAALEAIWGVS